MRRARFIVVLLSTLGLVFAGASAASAETPAVRAPEISFVAPVVYVSGSSSATVLGKYRCWGDSATTHLWVSAKQGGPDPTAEGSSSTVDAWYDTNVSGDIKVTCNGKWQITTVDLGRAATDFTGRPLGQLTKGKAWIQFCLVNPDGELLASKNTWAHVVNAR
jgi:hypothetical protein